MGFWEKTNSVKYYKKKYFINITGNSVNHFITVLLFILPKSIFLLKRSSKTCRFLLQLKNVRIMFPENVFELYGFSYFSFFVSITFILEKTDLLPWKFELINVRTL